MLEFRKNITHSVRKLSAVIQDDIDNFIAQSSIKTIKKGAFLINEGQICDALYYIHSGTFRSFFHSNDSNYVNNFGMENNFFTSFQSFISGKPSNVNIQAIDDAEISIWSKEVLEKLYKENNSWQEFGRKLAEQFYIDQEARAISLMSEPAKTKFMHFKRQWPQVFRVAPQYDIASYIGIAPESLSRLKKYLLENKSTSLINN